MFVTAVAGLFFNLIQVYILHSGDGHYHLGGGYDEHDHEHEHEHGHGHGHSHGPEKHHQCDHKEKSKHKHEHKNKEIKKIKGAEDLENNELKEGLIGNI